MVDSSNGFTDNQLDISRLLAAAIESCPAEAGVGVEGEPENLGPGLSVTQVGGYAAPNVLMYSLTRLFSISVEF